MYVNTWISFDTDTYCFQYVSKTLPPVPRPAPPPAPGSWESEESIGRGPYRATTASSRTYSRPSVDLTSFSNGTASPRSPRSPSRSRRNTHESTINMSQTRPVAPRRTGSAEAGSRETTLPQSSSFGVANPSHRLKSPPSVHLPQTGNGSNSGLPPLLFSRRPPSHPVLSPEYRYCSRDEFLKPMRAHHCRACGTVSTS